MNNSVKLEKVIVDKTPAHLIQAWTKQKMFSWYFWSNLHINISLLLIRLNTLVLQKIMTILDLISLICDYMCKVYDVHIWAGAYISIHNMFNFTCPIKLCVMNEARINYVLIIRPLLKILSLTIPNAAALMLPPMCRAN